MEGVQLNNLRLDSLRRQLSRLMMVLPLVPTRYSCPVGEVRALFLPSLMLLVGTIG